MGGWIIPHLGGWHQVETRDIRRLDGAGFGAKRCLMVGTSVSSASTGGLLLMICDVGLDDKPYGLGPGGDFTVSGARL